MKIILTSNAPKFFKKVEKDISEFNSGIGNGVADLQNMAFKEIRQKSFIDGARGSEKITGKRGSLRGQRVYEEFPGANKRAKGKVTKKGFKEGKLLFHKTKIVTRLYKLESRFDTIRFRKALPFKKTVSKGSNGSNQTKFVITQSGKEFTSSVIYGGKIRAILGNLHYGKNGKKNGTIIPGKTKGAKAGKKLGQNRSIANGYRRALRKWNRVIDGVMSGVIKKAGSV